MSFRIIHMIRHGQYDLEAQASDGGSLTRIGRKQAEHTAMALSHLTVEAIHCSTMIRAMETAAIIAETAGVDFNTHDLLREAIPSIPPRIATQILDLIEHDPSFDYESINADKQRADQAYETFFITPDEEENTQHELLVCHGNILRYLTCKALDINLNTWAKININHCGITTISIDVQGRTRLLRHNSAAHIPIELQTE